MQWGRGRKEKGHMNNITHISHELVFDISMVYVQEDKSGHCVRGPFHIPPKQVQDPGRGRSGPACPKACHDILSVALNRATTVTSALAPCGMLHYIYAVISPTGQGSN